VTVWVLDEAEELTDEKVFDKIDDSIRTKIHPNKVILILNPTTSEHWIYKRFFEFGQVSGVTYIHSTYLDNIENLSDSFIEKAEKVKAKNVEVYNHRYLGAWLDYAENAVFQNWSIGEFDNTLQLTCFGQDYGFSNDPTTLVKIAIDKAKKKIYLHECYYAKGLNTAQIFEANQRHAGRSTIVADCAEPRLISELSGRGMLMQKANKPKGSVSAQIKLMQDYEFIITKDSVNLQKEFKNYVWLANDIPIDDFNHGIDAARYAFDFLTNKGTGKYIIS
jgi:phage terminase large subunit